MAQLTLSCRVCDFLPKKCFHNSPFINHNFHLLCKIPPTLQFVIRPAIFDPPRICFTHPAPCNYFTTLQFFSKLPHPAVISTSSTPQIFQPPPPRDFFNLPHPAFFSTSCTPRFFQPPAPRICSTSSTPQFSTSRNPQFFNLPHPANYTYPAIFIHLAPRKLVTPHPAHRTSQFSNTHEKSQTANEI